jgi:hypothetical protein
MPPAEPRGHHRSRVIAAREGGYGSAGAPVLAILRRLLRTPRWVSDAAGDVAVVDPLAAMVLSYLDDREIELRPDDPKAEHRANTWRCGLPARFDVSAVASTLGHVVRQLSERQYGRPGTFYCWYDEQAGQPRCSLASKPADQPLSEADIG